MRRRIDMADDGLFLAAIFSDKARGAVPEVVQDLENVLRPIDRDLATLVAEAAAHLHPEPCRVDKLNLALTGRRLAVADDPDVGRDPGVVEELLRERDQCFQQIVFQDVPPDLTLSA